MVDHGEAAAHVPDLPDLIGVMQREHQQEWLGDLVRQPIRIADQMAHDGQAGALGVPLHRHELGEITVVETQPARFFDDPVAGAIDLLPDRPHVVIPILVGIKDMGDTAQQLQIAMRAERLQGQPGGFQPLGQALGGFMRFLDLGVVRHVRARNLEGHDEGLAVEQHPGPRDQRPVLAVQDERPAPGRQGGQQLVVAGRLVRGIAFQGRLDIRAGEHPDLDEGSRRHRNAQCRAEPVHRAFIAPDHGWRAGETGTQVFLPGVLVRAEKHLVSRVAPPDSQAPPGGAIWTARALPNAGVGATLGG